jgi:hypothetical protein
VHAAHLQRNHTRNQPDLATATLEMGPGVGGVTSKRILAEAGCRITPNRLGPAGLLEACEQACLTMRVLTRAQRNADAARHRASCAPTIAQTGFGGLDQ